MGGGEDSEGFFLIYASQTVKAVGVVVVFFTFLKISVACCELNTVEPSYCIFRHEVIVVVIYRKAGVAVLPCVLAFGLKVVDRLLAEILVLLMREVAVYCKAEHITGR